MSLIERTVQLSFQQRVFFTKYVFALSNPLLAEVLTNERSTQVPKVLIVLDESLHVAQPGLVRNIEAYFAAQAQGIKLVCPPMILEGGERVKNSVFPCLGNPIAHRPLSHGSSLLHYRGRRRRHS